MNFIAKFVVEHSRLAWGIALAAIAVLAIGAGEMNRDIREQQRLTVLETEAERRAVDVMSQTLNGTMMGAVSVLGLLDEEVKREAKGLSKPNVTRVVTALESVARSYDAEGFFIVGGDGVITSSWSNTGKRSTGLNVKFRPYFQMAMQGSANVYAAVSLTNGDRALYFSAPVFIDTTNATEAIGAAVARTGLENVDDVLRDKADIALLLSPQGVVFASTRKEWIGYLAGKLTSDRLKAIRELKQFGNMFEKTEPSVLPLEATPGRHSYDGRHFAVATAPVKWNDISGDWQLVLMEDLSRSVSPAERYWVVGGVALALLGMSVLLLFMLRGQYAQAQAAAQLQAFASQQEQNAAYKARMAAASLKFQQVADLRSLGQLFLTEVHALFGVLQAVFYAVDQQDAGRLQWVASYACSEPPANVLDVSVGVGLLGQCAIERRVMRIDTPDDEQLRIRSGLGDAQPASVLIAPVMLNEKLLGVVEFALPKALGSTEQSALEALVDLLAMNIEIVTRSVSTADQLGFQQALVDTIPYPVFYKGADTRFLGVNRAYETSFNVRREDLIGKCVLDLDYLSEADRLSYQAEDEAVIAGAKTIERDMRIPFADGELHDTLYYVSGFRRPDGSPGGLVGTFIDVTEMKQAQESLVRLSDAERFNRITQGREARILDLKREINLLCQRVSEPPRYASASGDTAADDSEELQNVPVGENLIESASNAVDSTQAAVTKLPSLAELVDLDELQTLFSAFCESVEIAAAIIDLEGNVLASSRWQRACTDYHRVNPDSCARCIESDTELSLKLQSGQDYTMYKCKNGMTDCASPIILEGQHLANVFIGQFHLGPPDMAFFRAQAKQFGYPEVEYLRAIADVPVADEKRLPVILGFLSGFARMISTMSLARYRGDLAQQRLQQQADQLQRERMAALSLAEDAEQSRRALAAIAKESQA